VTPPLCRFWRANGYRSVHLSATRNEASGEHSVVMLDPLSPAGRDLADRHSEWFRRRLPGALRGPLSAVDPDVVRAVIEATAGSVAVSLSDFEWRLVASAVDGPGQYGTAPAAFRRLAFGTLLDGWADDETERLLTKKVLQGRPWDETADALGYPSERACMRALGDAFGPIVETYGPAVAREELERYRDPT
jgi:tRNA(Met) cytidine acetyltransferase